MCAGRPITQAIALWELEERLNSFQTGIIHRFPGSDNYFLESISAYRVIRQDLTC